MQGKLIGSGVLHQTRVRVPDGNAIGIICYSSRLVCGPVKQGTQQGIFQCLVCPPKEPCSSKGPVKAPRTAFAMGPFPPITSLPTTPSADGEPRRLRAWCRQRQCATCGT